ncbi:MAG: HD domain-containing phosphohydrolase [Halanaerobiaceae bacterium]
MSGLYNQISSEFNNLRDRTYNKASLLAVSKAIEDVVINFDLQGRMFVFFQKEEFFLHEISRYQRLEKICDELYLFADNFSEITKSKFSEANFINLADFDDKTSQNMLKEWTVIIQHPEYSMALITKEIEGRQTIDQDIFRQFQGGLIFESSQVDAAILKLENYICDKYGTDRNFCRINIVKNEKERKAERRNQKMLSLFLNNALDQVESSFDMMASQIVMLDYSLEENERRTREIIKRLCFAAEYKDEDTAFHLISLSFTATLLYSWITDNPAKLKEMYYASLMHDIGKIGIPDNILLKPGELTPDEFEIIMTHPKIAYDILRNTDHSLLQSARKIAYTHHEKWDGSGYPERLSGEEIPIEGRIVAIADVFDALISERVYKEAYSLEKTLDIMAEGRDQHFDGRLLDVFFDNIDSIINFRNDIAKEFTDFNPNQVAEHFFKLEIDFDQMAAADKPEFFEICPQFK